MSRHLRTRIALFFVALLGVVQLVAFFAVNAANSANAERKLAAELDVGERIFGRLLESNAARLSDAVKVLAADFGFREALATGDIDTVASVLSNHGARIKADLSLLISLQGTVVASTLSAQGGQAGEALTLPDLPALIGTAQQSGKATTIEFLDGRLYQVVLVPVLAPVPIAWLTMGFEVDNELAVDLRQLSGLDLSFAVGDPDWRLVASTLDAASQNTLQANLPAGDATGLSQLAIGDERFQLRSLLLKEQGGIRVYAVLQRSLSEAIAAFNRLRQTLLVLGIVSLLVSGIGSMVIARGITRPLSELADTAQRIEAGDYESAMAVNRPDEIGVLARGLKRMRQAIAAREQEILRLAFEDTLTRLPNRACFRDRLTQALRTAERTGGALTVLSLDLDRFKQINETLGHAVGDHVLKEVGQRLQAELRTSDTVARLGGDEYGILLPTGDAAGVLAFVNKVVALLEAPIIYEGQPMDVGASIGVAHYPAHGNDAATLARNAEIAMAVAKAQKSTFAIFDPAYDNSRQEHLYLLGELRRAVEQRELRLYYQPKVRLTDGQVVGVESLIRWQHPTRGLVPPGDFIPFAENTGYIRILTQWALSEGIAQCARWRKAGLNLRVSVNIAARDLTSKDLPDRVAELLRTFGVPADLLCLEITESGFMADPVHANRILGRLAALGIHLSIDDYGTGYSSLSYVMNLPVDELKLDRSFVVAMSKDPDTATIIRSTADLGHGLGLEVVAEGVETQAEYDALRALGIDHVQGYFLSRPLPAEQLSAWVAERSLVPV